MAKQRCCARCVFSGPVQDGARTLYICSNVPDCPGQMVLRPPDGVCPHFRARRGKPVPSEPRESDDPWIRYIPLTDGLHALVDASDFAWLRLHRWSAYRTAHTHYAYRYRHGEISYMHQEIMLPVEGYVVDHKNGAGWDNRRSNMRNCTAAQNGCNRAKWKRTCSSQYKGVSRHPYTGRYIARIGHLRGRIHLGTFDLEIDAARAYDRAAIQYHGLFARLNFPEEWVTGHWVPVPHDPAEEPDDRGQTTEDSEPKAEDGGQKTEGGKPGNDPPNA